VLHRGRWRVQQLAAAGAEMQLLPDQCLKLTRIRQQVAAAVVKMKDKLRGKHGRRRLEAVVCRDGLKHTSGWYLCRLYQRGNNQVLQEQ
jgi:hypothetical protein